MGQRGVEAGDSCEGRGTIISLSPRPGPSRSLSVGKTNPSLPQLEVSSHLSSPTPHPPSPPPPQHLQHCDHQPSSQRTVAFHSARAQHACSSFLHLDSVLQRRSSATQLLQQQNGTFRTRARVYSKAQQASEEAAESRENLH